MLEVYVPDSRTPGSAGEIPVLLQGSILGCMRHAPVDRRGHHVRLEVRWSGCKRVATGLSKQELRVGQRQSGVM